MPQNVTRVPPGFMGDPERRLFAGLHEWTGAVGSEGVYHRPAVEENLRARMKVHLRANPRLGVGIWNYGKIYMPGRAS